MAQTCKEPCTETVLISKYYRRAGSWNNLNRLQGSINCKGWDGRIAYVLQQS